MQRQTLSQALSLVRRRQLASAADLPRHVGLLETIGDRLLERVALIRREPLRILDIGCRSGYLLQMLGNRYPRAEIVGIDPAADGMACHLEEAQLRRRPEPSRVTGDPHALPFADGSFDLVLSNLWLPWSHAPSELFAEVRRVLSPEGAFLFTTAGPGTLLEYRRAWSTIDHYEHTFGLIDMHHLGDALLGCGLADPVLDREDLQLEYADGDALQREMRALGAANLALGRRRGLMAPSAVDNLSDRLARRERVVVTLELLHGHAWCSGANQPGQGQDGEFRFPVEGLRAHRLRY